MNTRRMTVGPMKFVRIDVHAHVLPDFYHDALVNAGQRSPDGFPGILKWSEEAALKMMDQLQIDAALLSISSLGVHFGDDESFAKPAVESIAQRKTKIHVTILFESNDITSVLCCFALWMPQTTSPKGRAAHFGQAAIGRSHPRGYARWQANLGNEHSDGPGANRKHHPNSRGVKGPVDYVD
jgi:hypothetical protein